MRIQIILTVFVVVANLIGIGVATLLVTVAFPTPSVFSDAPLWITFGVTPAYCVVALGFGNVPDHPTNHRRSAVGDRRAGPHPGGRARHVLRTVLVGPRRADAVGDRHRFADDALWVGRHHVHSEVGFCVSFCGIVVSAAATCSPSSRCDRWRRRRWRPARRRGDSHQGSWAARCRLGARLGRARARHPARRDAGRCAAGQSEQDPVGGGDPRDLTAFALMFGFILMWILAWLTATPVRVVRAALNRVEARRSRHRSRGVRRHRTRPAAARVQLDGRRAARA